MGAAPGLPQGSGPAQGRAQHHGAPGQARGSLRSWRCGGGPGLEAVHARCQGAAGPRAVGDLEQPGSVLLPSAREQGQPVRVARVRASSRVA